MKRKSNRRKAKKQVKTRKQYSGKVSQAIIVSAREQNPITCRIMEYQELQAIEKEMAGQLTDKFVYQFKQYDKDAKKWKIIRGIRAVGVREAVRFCKVKPYCFIPKFFYELNDLGDGYYREVVSCQNPYTKEITRSTCQWRRGDRFSDRTAQTNAERNTLLKQIPAQMQLQFINYCIKNGKFVEIDVNPELPENKKAITELASDEEKTETAGKEKTAGLARIWAVANKMKVDQAKFRAWLHKSYKVASMKDIDIEMQKKIANGLSDIYNNAPGRCAKPKSNIMTCDEFVAMIAEIKLDDKGEMVKK